MKNKMIGKTVQLKTCVAKWHLDNMDVYTSCLSNNTPEEYDEEIQMHLLCCMGVPMTGKVTRAGADKNVYGVKFRIGKLETFYYVEKKDIEVVNG